MENTDFRAEEWLKSWVKIWKLKSAFLTAKVYWAVASVANTSNPEEARKKATDETENLYTNLFPEYWIDFEVNFSEESIKNFKETIDAIISAKSQWIVSNEEPLLWLWNHQAYWIEAIWAYYFLPNRARILLKDDLLLPPLFWKWIKALDPIVFNRKLSKKDVIIEVNNEQRKTIDAKKPVLVFPEWTRAKDWILNKFNPLLYKWAYEAIQNHDSEVSKKVAIITADTFNIFPSTMEKTMFWLWKSLNTWTVSYTIDIVEIDVNEGIKNFNWRVYEIVKNNLMKY